MQRVEQEYDVLRTQVESTVSHAADQLDKAGAALKEVGVLLEAQDVALDSLAQAYADSDLTKVKAPMAHPRKLTGKKQDHRWRSCFFCFHQ